MADPQTVFDIKVWFDTICPWCYIGDKVFQQAIQLYQKTYPGGSKDVFNILYLPYYLDSKLPTTGTPMTEQIAQKNGQERVNAIQTRLQRVGRSQGIEFSFRGKIANTRESHRLIMYAGTNYPAQQKPLIDEIFRSLFEGSMDIGSFDDLLSAAVAVGMNVSDVASYLKTTKGMQEADALAAEARASGVTSVPTVEINGVRIEGAEDASVFYDALVKAKTGGQEAFQGTATC